MHANKLRCPDEYYLLLALRLLGVPSSEVKGSPTTFLFKPSSQILGFESPVTWRSWDQKMQVVPHEADSETTNLRQLLKDNIYPQLFFRKVAREISSDPKPWKLSSKKRKWSTPVRPLRV